MPQKLFCFIVLASLLFACTSKITDADKKKILGFTEMSDMATVEYTLSKIVKANDKTAWYKIGDRKIAMSIMAYAKAGIDLSKVNADNINQKNGTVTIDIPPAKIISVSIPPEEIKEEMTEIGSLRNSFDNVEKNELLKQAEVSINQTLDSIGILTKAEQNARAFIEKFANNLGYKKITINVNPNLK